MTAREKELSDRLAALEQIQRRERSRSASPRRDSEKDDDTVSLAASEGGQNMTRDRLFKWRDFPALDYKTQLAFFAKTPNSAASTYYTTIGELLVAPVDETGDAWRRRYFVTSELHEQWYHATMSALDGNDRRGVLRAPPWRPALPGSEHF